MEVRYLFLILSFVVILFTACTKYPEADLVILGGKVITLEDDYAEASAIAVIGDTIAAVGTDDDIEDYIGGSTKVIKLNGETVIPGFNDSHAHLLSLGKSLMNINLSGKKNWDEIIYTIAEAASKAPPGQWIIGRGWHQEKWDPPAIPNYEGYPYHNQLSAATPKNPVLLTHASGHAVFANEYAMKLAGIDDSTKNPDGGRIVRDSTTGKAIGVFEENAENLLRSVYDKNHSENKESVIKELETSERECLRYGITSFTDAGSSFKEIDVFKELADSNKLRIRLNVMLSEPNENLRKRINEYKIVNYRNHFLNVRSIKRYIDGALGSRGAWLLEEYSDMPGYFGQEVTPLDELAETAEIAAENGFQMCTHAIGDRGNREIMNIYEKTLAEYPEGKSFRWRIEHAQHLNPADIPRFAENGIIAAMQGIHCTSDAPFVIKRLGEERAKNGAYAWRKLIDSGALICNGTDAPVESVNPFPNFYALITRNVNDSVSFYPEEKMTRIEALKAYTINGAYASFEENIKGTLTKGKLADIAVLSKNILTVPENEIPDTKVLFTIVGGRIEYSAK